MRAIGSPICLLYDVRDVSTVASIVLLFKIQTEPDGTVRGNFSVCFVGMSKLKSASSSRRHSLPHSTTYTYLYNIPTRLNNGEFSRN